MNVEIKGLDELKRIVSDIKSDILNDSSEMLDYIADKVVFPSIIRNFKEEGRPKWQGLAPRTQLERAGEGYPPAHPILYRSGELFRNSTTKDGVNYDLGKHQLTMDCMLRKGEWLHFGVGKTPARPFFYLQKEDDGIAEREVGVFISKKLLRIVKA
jgi:phage gpG-like protein